MSSWDDLSGFLVRRRRVALAAAAVISAACGALLPRLRVTPDPTGFYPRSNPAVSFWLDLSKRFDALDVLVVGLEEPQHPLTADGLHHLDRITRRLADLKAEGVLGVRSLTNVETFQEGSDGSVEADLFIPKIPGDVPGLEALRAHVAASPQVFGSLISRDQFAYVVLVRADPRKDPSRVARTIRQVVDAERGLLRAYYFGAPFLSAGIGREAINSLARYGWLVPTFLVLILATFAVDMRLVRIDRAIDGDRRLVRTQLAVGVRRPSIVITVLGSAGLAVLWSLGLAKVLGVPLDATSATAILPIFLLALAAYGRIIDFASGELLGSADGEATRADPVAGVFLAVVAVGVGGLAAALVTSTSYLGLVGRMLAIGAACIALVGLAVLVPIAPLVPPARPPPPFPISSRRGAGFAVAALVGLVGAALSWKAHFAVTPRAIFGDAGAAAGTLSFFDRYFGGADAIQVSYRGDLRDPAVAARLMRLTDLVEGTGRFGDVRSVSQVLGFLAQGFDGIDRIPTSRDSLGALWFFLEGNPDVRNLVDEQRDEAMIAIRVPSTSTTRGDDIAALQKATVDSLQTGGAAARLRLRALAAESHLELPEARLSEALEAAGRAPTDEEQRSIAKRVQSGLQAWLGSADSPYRPSAEDWARIRAALEAPESEKGARLDDVSKALPGLGDADLSRKFRDTLLDREKALRLAARAGGLASALWAGVPETAAHRATGIFADLLDPHAGAGESATVTVSGLPVVAPEAEGTLLRGLWLALAVLIGVSALGILAGSRSSTRAARAAFAGSLATVFIGGALVGLGYRLDPTASIVLFAAPLAAIVLSLPGPSESGQRVARAFLRLVGMAAVPLLLVDVLPLVRLAVVLAIGLLGVDFVALVASSVFGSARPAAPAAPE